MLANMSGTLRTRNQVGRLFCEVSSIRGLHKISLRVGFLRAVWVAFVIIMTIVLLVSSSYLVFDYLSYTTAWHTSSARDDPSDFPAITVCAQNPFATKANQLWKRGHIMTPSNLSSRLTQFSLWGIHNKSENLAYMRLYDKFDTYYSNLSPQQSQQLSHLPNIMRYCIMLSEDNLIVYENCSMADQQQFKVVLFSNDEYYNCYTVQGLKGTTANITDIIIVVALVPTEGIPELESNFLLDTLNRGEGLKVVIHEVDRYPDVKKNGINLHPAKLNGIVYSLTKWTMYSSPVSECSDDNKPYLDLNRKFEYTFRQCLDLEFQKHVMNKCKCMMTMMPRPQIPTPSLPYCLFFVNQTAVQLSERFGCLNLVMMDKSEVTNKAAREVCKPRCSYTTYTTEMSTTKWSANQKKLELLRYIYRDFNTWFVDMDNKVKKDKLIKTLHAADPSSVNKNGKSIVDKLSETLSDKFTYISLRRKNLETTIKEEKLVLDMNVLLSRIGGLCSLCIGLTAAVIVEAVEFFYFWLQLRLSDSGQQGTKLNHGEEIVELNGENCQHSKHKGDCIDCHSPTCKFRK